MRTRRWLLLIWLCFVARGVFYSAAVPLWEGYDEWSHFAVIRWMAVRGDVLVSRDSPVPRDVQASLELVPLPTALRDSPPPAVTHDAYWRLSIEERRRREASFRSMPFSWKREESGGGLKAYEALQPPLYAWMMALPLRLSGTASLAAQVLWLRLLSVAIASLTIPLVFFVGRSVFGKDGVALGAAAIVAAMPEFAVDIARVGNECVAVVLFTALTWMMIEWGRMGFSRSRALGIGLVLGLGLLAKAYFLAAVPAIVVVLLYRFWRARGRRRQVLFEALIIGSVSTALAGWWYARNVVTTGTLSGLSESVMLRGMGVSSMLGKVSAVHWRGAIDSILFSHLWFGGWSGLTVRSWMYHLFYALILLAALGLCRMARQSAIFVPAAVYGTFWVALLYDVLILFLSRGVSTSTGWYLYAVIGAEVALAIAGLQALAPGGWRRWIPATGVFLFALLDLYTVHCVAVPYYTGVIAHRANGSLAALHLTDVSRIGVPEILARLAAYKAGILTEPVLAALWAAYAVATLSLVVLSSLTVAEEILLPGKLESHYEPESPGAVTRLSGRRQACRPFRTP
jgi:hypothetical protein